MKNGLQFNPMLFKLVLMFTCFMLVMFYNKSKAANYSAAQQPKSLHVAAR